MSQNPDYPLFLDNESTDEYMRICHEAIERGDTDEYFEQHMIIPMDFWRFAPESVDGVYPEELRIYCPLTPEEHWRVHELLVGMFPHGSKQFCIAKFSFSRIKKNHPEANTAEEYGAAQRAYNQDKIITDEGQKYPHLALFFEGIK